MKGCVICGRPVEGHRKLCRYHKEAELKLREGFRRWQEALEIEWNEYINRVEEIEETGKWIREIIQYIRLQNNLLEH